MCIIGNFVSKVIKCILAILYTSYVPRNCDIDGVIRHNFQITYYLILIRKKVMRGYDYGKIECMGAWLHLKLLSKMWKQGKYT